MPAYKADEFEDNILKPLVEPSSDLSGIVLANDPTESELARTTPLKKAAKPYFSKVISVEKFVEYERLADKFAVVVDYCGRVQSTIGEPFLSFLLTKQGLDDFCADFLVPKGRLIQITTVGKMFGRWQYMLRHDIDLYLAYRLLWGRTRVFQDVVNQNLLEMVEVRPDRAWSERAKIFGKSKKVFMDWMPVPSYRLVRRRED